MPKKSIYPISKPLTIVRMNRTKFTTVSTSEADTLYLDANYETHQAWSGVHTTQVNQKAAKVSKFNKMFSFISFLKSEQNEEASVNEQANEEEKS